MKEHKSIQLIRQVRQNISQISSTFNSNEIWWAKFLCVMLSAGMELCQHALGRISWLKLCSL